MLFIIKYNYLENFINIWLKIKSLFRYILKISPNLKKPKEVLNYRLTFCDFFQGTKLDESKWLIGQPWGDFHPDNSYEYYGKTEEFVYVEDGCLNLIAKYKPKKFYDFKNNTFLIIPKGKGLVFSKYTFKYGYYEINAVLPNGKYLWPAIWLTASKSWPPEIDILEAYSGNKSNYQNKLGIPNFKFQPNLHYGFTEDKTKENYGAKSYPLPMDPTSRSITYGLHWTENFIKIYYDGYLVFQTYKKEILDYFNEKNVTMNIVLNNGFQPEGKDLKEEPSNFKINYVKFFKK